MVSKIDMLLNDINKHEPNEDLVGVRKELLELRVEKNFKCEENLFI